MEKKVCEPNSPFKWATWTKINNFCWHTIWLKWLSNINIIKSILNSSNSCRKGDSHYTCICVLFIVRQARTAVESAAFILAYLWGYFEFFCPANSYRYQGANSQKCPKTCLRIILRQKLRRLKIILRNILTRFIKVVLGHLNSFADCDALLS